MGYRPEPDDFAPNPPQPSRVVDPTATAADDEPASLKSPLGPPATNVPEPPTKKHTSDDDRTGQTSDSNTVKANFEGKDPGPGTVVNEGTVGRQAGQEKYEGKDYEHRKR